MMGNDVIVGLFGDGIINFNEVKILPRVSRTLQINQPISDQHF